MAENEEHLAQVVGQLLRGKKLTLSVAESCTGGLVSKMITDIPDASFYFKGGIVPYHDTIKYEILGVDRQILEKYGAVSSQVAIAMARNIKKLCKTDIGIGVTGIAGPGGGTAEKPVGLVYIAYAYQTKEDVLEQYFTGDRLIRREKTALFALDNLRRMLLEE